ncbi:MAG: hypothetical protein A2381_14340 [Bdellovibrionales bacterium RIFOXYB1_FULL_37_110]|nr:MAG: hypothetical protein A2417_07110 [Bdellovibrionales bacterium RIFOXYC1_FULL_37_79]OFZ57521.1 MAG: hypothetical protein A2381_14340 [Bdellovibrionales bacterium RIFOXYB1_FULL_37_110]OFZ62992.1 MAG: hypothetical protein A2577_07620 [Bdellovibrionales bacterium RIFOXYD1_FULL_36_51]
MEHSIFDFNNYQEYIIKKIQSFPQKGRGKKSDLSLFINCQTTYLSRILSGKADFNLEQAEAVTRFFNLNKIEKKYFITLVQLQKAGTQEAKAYLEGELKDLKEQSLNLKKRLEVKNNLTEQEKEQYYSHWLYSVVHVLTTISFINSAEQIAKCLSIPVHKIQESLDFLQNAGLVKVENNNISIGVSKLHLASDSHLIYHHHRNWRLQALSAIDRALERNLHYSSVVTLSEQDVYKVKNYLIEAIKSVKKIISESKPEERCYSFNLDFFDVMNTNKF